MATFAPDGEVASDDDGPTPRDHAAGVRVGEPGPIGPVVLPSTVRRAQTISGSSTSSGLANVSASWIASTCSSTSDRMGPGARPM